MMHYRHLGERFFEKVDKGDEDWHCWEWKGMKRNGYGYVVMGRVPSKPKVCKTVRAHRISYRLANMYPVEPEVVMHLCNNRLCVNPLHLRGGTHLENADHMAQSRRSTLGSKNPNSKLSEASVRKIIADQRLHREIAADHGVSKSLISMIKSGHSWKTAIAIDVGGNEE